VTLGKLYSQLLAFETRLELQSGGHPQIAGHAASSVNNASRGRGGFTRGHGGCGQRGGFGRG
jgi:hypothetical protein